MRQKNIVGIILSLLFFFTILITPNDVFAEKQSQEPIDIIVKFKNSKQKQLFLTQAGFAPANYRELKSLNMIVVSANEKQKQRLTELKIPYTPNKTIHINPLVINEMTKPEIPNNYMIDLGIYELWDKGYKGDGVKIGVMDTGTVYNHLDLSVKKGIGTASTREKVKYNDRSGHGTHVTGIIGAKDNKIGAVGVVPNAEIYPIRIFDDEDICTIENILKGIEWAINHNIDIVNMSFGTEDKEEFLQDAIELAYDRGIITVAAAGNENTKLTYPAAYPIAVAVGSVNDSLRVSKFSNHGKQLDLVAPGEDVYSTFLHNSFKLKSGTSMSTPVVSGILAIMKEAYPKLSWDERMKMIEATSLDLGATGRDTYYGYGLPQPLQLMKVYPPSNFQNYEPTNKKWGTLKGTIKVKGKTKTSIPNLFYLIEEDVKSSISIPMHATLLTYHITFPNGVLKQYTHWGYIYEDNYFKLPITESGNYKIDVYAMAKGYESSFIGSTNFEYVKPKTFTISGKLKSKDALKLSFTSSVKDSKNKPVKDVAVSLEVTYPNKKKSKKVIKTNSSGKTSITLSKIKQKGSYVVKAKFSKNGYNTVTKSYIYKN